ncbi:hypothetical protein AV530_010375 [Patagioenas fasciata monilis]|uniref:Uncharacterized protein n=1 Tax=Patagioenas fasciata monilis TaxID=372326 RepID=A0A1V4KES3_PATFA|nr:hypothetical protein AV530_010375 [Patagioenas fasciata monilis]
MAEGPRSWRDFIPAKGNGEEARGATANLRGAVDAESTGQAQCSRLCNVDPAWEEMSGTVAVVEVEEQFLHLAIRKQVSYRRLHTPAQTGVLDRKTTRHSDSHLSLVLLAEKPVSAGLSPLVS